MLKKIFILFLINISILGPRLLFSEEPLSLENLIKEAKENSPDILARQSLVLLEAISAIAESKYSVGEISQEDVFKLHLEIAKFYNNIMNLEEEKAAKQARLNTLLNRELQGCYLERRFRDLA